MSSEQEENDQSTSLNLTGTVLQITTRFANEYTYDVRVTKVNDSNGQPTYEFVGGYALDVFLYLQNLLNFTYKLRPDHPITFDKDQVENASLDFYVGSFSLLSTRAKVLDPTFPIGRSRILAFMDHSFEGDIFNQNIYLMPFTTGLWICAVIAWLLFLIGFLVLNYFERDSSMYEIVFHCVTVTLQKGTYLEFFHNSTRIATVILSFSIVIIMASYSGVMTSISALNRYTVNTIDALVQSNYEILLEYGYGSNSSSIKFMLEALMHLSSVLTLMRKANRSNFVFQSFDDSITQVSQGPAAYIIDEETGLVAVTDLLGGMPCTWSKIPVFNLQYPWVMYIRKNAPFKQQINLGIVRIRERGMQNRFRKKWIPQTLSGCATGDGNFSFKSITFSQVFMPTGASRSSGDEGFRKAEKLKMSTKDLDAEELTS